MTSVASPSVTSIASEMNDTNKQQFLKLGGKMDNSYHDILATWYDTVKITRWNVKRQVAVFEQAKLVEGVRLLHYFLGAASILLMLSKLHYQIQGEKILLNVNGFDVYAEWLATDIAGKEALERLDSLSVTSAR